MTTRSKVNRTLNTLCGACRAIALIFCSTEAQDSSTGGLCRQEWTLVRADDFNPNRRLRYIFESLR